jgi:hypothetical protein
MINDNGYNENKKESISLENVCSCINCDHNIPLDCSREKCKCCIELCNVLSGNKDYPISVEILCGDCIYPLVITEEEFSQMKNNLMKKM